MSEPTYYNVEARKDTVRYPVKDISQKRKGGTINNWEVIEWFGTGNHVVTGVTENDFAWGTASDIRTSIIVSISADQKTLETLNTVYTLGTPKHPHWGNVPDHEFDN